MNSFQKLEYIYQHFQDNKKIYESDPDAAGYETDNTLYPHINNDIEYGLFQDVVNPSFTFYIYICNFYLSNGRLIESPPTVCTQQHFKSIYLCIML